MNMVDFKHNYIIKLFLPILFFNFICIFEVEEVKANKKVFSPNGVNYVYYKMSSREKAKIFVYNNLLNTLVTITEISLRYPLDKGISWHNDDLVEINIKTGSPGNFSIFYSVNNDKISEKHYFPLAVDPNRYLVLLGDEEVYITGIFDTKNRYKLDLDFQVTAIKWLIFDRTNTYFDETGNLIFKYRNTNNEWVTGRLEQDLIKLGNPCNKQK